MSRPVNIQETLTFVPALFDQSNSTYDSVSGSYPASNALTNSDSTTYAQFNIVTGEGAETFIYYNFDTSDIPAGATINSVTCSVKAYINTTNSSRITARQIQLFSGNIAKGSASTFSNYTNVITMTPGSWTVTELRNARIRAYVKRGTSNTTSAYTVRIYGATLSINYSISGTEYEIVSTLATDAVNSIDPAGQTWIFEGNAYELAINDDSIDDIAVLDNGTDVTSQLVRHEAVHDASVSTVLGAYTLESGSFNGSGASYFQGLVGKGENATQTTTNYYSSGSGVIAVFNYKLIFEDIPSNATITSLYCKVNGHAESTSNNNEYMCVQLVTGSTELSDELNFKSIGTSNSTQTITATTLPTISQLSDLRLRCRLGYYGGAINGATCYLEYTVPGSNAYYWTYTITGVSADHTIIVQNNIIEIPDEDPEYNYYPITISSINATTTPGKGTVRLVEGSNQTITIVPQDPSITLILDNGQDVSNQLVSVSGPQPSYTIDTAPGASYGFTYSSSTMYYTSQNKGVGSSAAVARVSFDLPVRCLVTFQYINYAEETYDFGVFGKIDTTLSTAGWTSSSNAGDSTTDAGLEQIRLNTSSSNSANPQTLTYEIPAGIHYIDVKFGKDQSSDSYNDTLQFKITDIQELEPNNSYTYTLSNIQEPHSLIFIFGDVTYYFVNSSGTNARLFPSGQMVQLPGDTYRITIVPDDYSYSVTVTDNGADVTSSVERKEEQITKEGVTTTVVNYIYTISNIQATHNIIVSCSANESLYIKISGAYVRVSKIWKKADDRWNEVAVNTLTEPAIFISKN